MKKIKIFVSVLCLASCLISSAQAAGGLIKAKAANGTMIDAANNQILVKYKKGRSAQAKTQIFSLFATKTRSSLRAIDVETLQVPVGESVETFIQKLKSNPDVEFAEPNGIVKAYLTANDPDFMGNLQYYLGPNFLDIENAWDVTPGTTSIVVAVLDTGITISHPDFDGQLIPSTGTTIEIDWDSDNTIDTGLTCNDNNVGPDQAGGGLPLDDNFDSCLGGSNIYHGTRVSGIIAAKTNNATNMAGIARNCRLMAVKVLNSKGSGLFSSIAEGIVYAVDHGADVINMSLGVQGATSDSVTAAVNYALENNVVVVAAAGNEAPCSVGFPASIPRVIAVGSTDTNDLLANFSCTGRDLDLVAPGVDITSVDNGGASSDADGTSFSSPMVAAVAALIRSLNPTMPVTDVTRYLDFYADDLGPSGFDTNFGFGRLNANRAMVAAAAGAPFVSNPANPGETFPYPNPYNPTLGTSVHIALPSSLGSQGLEIKIMNLSGVLVKTLTGTNDWDGKNDDGNFVASGLYFYFAKTSQGDVKGKLTVLK